MGKKGFENSNISNQSISSVLPKTVQLAAGFIILEFVSKKIILALLDSIVASRLILGRSLAGQLIGGQLIEVQFFGGQLIEGQLIGVN